VSRASQSPVVGPAGCGAGRGVGSGGGNLGPEIAFNEAPGASIGERATAARADEPEAPFRPTARQWDRSCAGKMGNEAGQTALAAWAAASASHSARFSASKSFAAWIGLATQPSMPRAA